MTIIAYVQARVLEMSQYCIDSTHAQDVVPRSSPIGRNAPQPCSPIISVQRHRCVGSGDPSDEAHGYGCPLVRG